MAIHAVAGLGPGDIDVAEVHDAAAPAELIITEVLGFCEPGGGAALLRSGETTLGGRRPVNPSGGVMSWAERDGVRCVLYFVADQWRFVVVVHGVADDHLRVAVDDGGRI